MKKILVLTLAVLMLAGMLPMTAVAYTAVEDYDYDKYFFGMPDEEYDERFGYLKGAPELQPGDLLRAGHPEVNLWSGPMYGGVGRNIFTSSFGKGSDDSWRTEKVDSQWDWFVYGDQIEYMGRPPILTYDDGTVVVGTHEILSDGEHTTIVFDGTKTDCRWELWMPFCHVAADKPTYIYMFVDGERCGPVISYRPEYPNDDSPMPSRPSAEGSVLDYLELELDVDPYGEFYAYAFVSLIMAPIPPAGSGIGLTMDQPSSWAVAEVGAAITAGLVPRSLQSGYTQPITRAEYCALATALYEKYTGAEITGRGTFIDTDDVNVQKMAAVGIVNGVGGDRFAPDDTLTREQAAVMLTRIAEAIDKPFAAAAPTFADNSEISDWAFAQVGQAQVSSIMGGVDNNTFAPKDSYTREQSIITMLRLWKIVGPSGW